VGRPHASVRFVLAALAAAGPVLVSAQRSTPGPIPNCATLDPSSIASLLTVPALTLEKNTGPLCTFTGKKPSRYLIEVDITIIPYSDSVWGAAENAAIKRHDYKQESANLFFSDRTVTSHGLPPCNLGDQKAGQLGPKCSGEPDQNVYTVVGRGNYKTPTGPKLMVTAATSAQSGDIYLGHVIELVKEILSGKIH